MGTGKGVGTTVALLSREPTAGGVHALSFGDSPYRIYICVCVRVHVHVRISAARAAVRPVRDAVRVFSDATKNAAPLRPRDKRDPKEREKGNEGTSRYTAGSGREKERGKWKEVEEPDGAHGRLRVYSRGSIHGTHSARRPCVGARIHYAGLPSKRVGPPACTRGEERGRENGGAV